MKRLNYLDYVKTPEDWKLKALDIPNQTKIKHSKKYRPSAILVACITVISLSGIGAFAVESGAIDVLRREFFKHTYTPYSYSGTYNDTLDNSALDEYIKTDVQVENLSISRDGIDFKVTGYLCDRNIAFITADIILPEDCTYSPQKGYVNTDIERTNISCNNENVQIGSYGIDIKDVQDNVVSVLFTIQSIDKNIYNNSYEVSFSDLGSCDYNLNFIPEYEFNVSFDITLKDCRISNSVDNINRTITLKDGITTTLTSIDYSPLRINFNFDNIHLSEKYFEYSGQESKIANQFTMYYIYNDGRKVFIDRAGIYHNRIDDYDVTQLCIDYALMCRDLIDFTNIVAIEINGEVIPLK